MPNRNFYIILPLLYAATFFSAACFLPASTHLAVAVVEVLLPFWLGHHLRQKGITLWYRPRPAGIPAHRAEHLFGNDMNFIAYAFCGMGPAVTGIMVQQVPFTELIPTGNIAEMALKVLLLAIITFSTFALPFLIMRNTAFQLSKYS